MDRLAEVGKIPWYPGGDLACPSQLIVKPDEVRVVRYWSNSSYGLNGVLSNPDVDRGAMDPGCIYVRLSKMVSFFVEAGSVHGRLRSSGLFPTLVSVTSV